MSDRLQQEIPKVCINLTLDLHASGAKNPPQFPLNLLAAGDFSQRKGTAPLSEREKMNRSKNPFNPVLAEYVPDVNLVLETTPLSSAWSGIAALLFQEKAMEMNLSRVAQMPKG
ncbi:type VI secretion system contractile sheath small subunit [Enterobacteriaceae bacterium LUAb1]